jgi:hypothetical protein
LELKYTLRFNTAFPIVDTEHCPEGARVLFVGFKNSLEALYRYDIYVNANKLYSQSWVGQESFIYNAGLSQTMREKQPYVYTCWKNVADMSNDVCGTYIKFDNDTAEIPAGHEIEVTIPVKINLHQILMLASVRYLPSFCGRWEIELYPSAQNLVVLPVPLINTYKIGKGPAEDLQCRDFTQIAKQFKQYVGWDTTKSEHTFKDQIITCPTAILKTCLMNTTTFQLRFEVFEGLRQMYVEQPLIIPTNILNYGRFSGEPSDNKSGSNFHATLSQSLENCDSIFILVPFSNGQTTCFYQPYLKEMRLSLGEFGVRPARYVQTWDDPRFLAMVLDSLNLETSEITSMNEDVARSLNTQRKCYEVTKTGGKFEVKSWDKRPTYGDKSNFFIGFSLSQVGFQSGTVSSPNTNVPFIFDATLDREGRSRDPDANPALSADDRLNKDYLKIDTSVIVMFLIDCAIMIQVVADSDIPVVKLTSKSIV